MRIVLGIECFPDAVGDDELGVRAICDEIVISTGIRGEYAKRAGWSNLESMLEQHRRNRPRKFNMHPHLGAVTPIQGLRTQHDVIVRDAVRARADFLVTEYRPWLQLENELLEQHRLQVITPQRYVAERKRGGP